MTTPEAQARYEADHARQHRGRPCVIHNPKDLSVSDLPFIYGFNNGGGGDWWHAQLLAEDGTPLGSHICSSETYMPADLGVLEGTRADRHERFREHYPDGYRMEFVSGSDVGDHPGLQEAMAEARRRGFVKEPHA